MSTGYIRCASLYAATLLDIADLLEAGPRSITDLALATNSHADAFHRTLRALAGMGIIRKFSPRF